MQQEEARKIKALNPEKVVWQYINADRNVETKIRNNIKMED